MRPLIAVLLLLSGVSSNAAITGRVVDEGGKPLRGARVRVHPLETSDEYYARLLRSDPERAVLASAETREDGTFLVETKGQAVVSLAIDAPGRQLLIADTADGDGGATFALYPLQPQRGRVTANGKPVANATIFSGGRTARSDAEGYYEVQPDGPFTVMHPDYAIYDRRSYERTPDVVLESGTLLRGRVIDESGRPVAGATIRANNWPLARSGDDGTFEIAHASTELRTLQARAGKRVGAALLKPPYVIRVRPGATVSGTVRSTKDETPVALANVWLHSVPSGSPAVLVLADAKGNFTMEAVEPGSYTMGLGHPDFMQTSVPLRLESGMRMNRVLYGTPYARVSGKVTVDDERPVAGARLVLHNGGFRGVTAPDGTFRVRVPPSAQEPQTLEVRTPSFALAKLGPLTLQPGEIKSGVHIRLQRGFQLEVRLIDKDGVAIAGESVRVRERSDSDFSPSRTEMPCGPMMEPSKCLTDAEGRLVVTLAEDTYDIRAGGLHTVSRELRSQTLTPRSSPLTIELDRGVTIEGRVFWSDGTPAQVSGRMMTDGRPPYLGTLTAGTFALYNVPAGRTLVVAEIETPFVASSEPVEVTAPASGVVVMLQRPGRIEGRVIDRETEKPLRAFTITLRQATMRRRPPQPKLFESDDGTFTLGDVFPGNYELQVTATGYAGPATAKVTVEEGKSAAPKIALDRGMRVVGRVTTEGRPLPAARVSLESSPSPPFAFATAEETDANGEFTLEGVAAGAHELRVQRDGYVRKEVEVNVTPGKETRVDVELARGREVQGRVVDHAGVPVPLAHIFILSEGPFGSPSMQTDANGAFRLTGVGDERFEISARKGGYVPGKAVITPQMNDVTITLERGGTITGRVVGLSAVELAEVVLNTFKPGSFTMNNARPDATGAFTLTGIPDGEVRVTGTLSRSRFRMADAVVVVTNGIAPPVTLDFGSGFTVRGRVTRKGKPVEGFISFLGKGIKSGAGATSGLGRDGTYEIRVGEAGEYQVVVGTGAGGGSANVATLQVAGDMVRDFDLRETAIQGRVVDAVTGQPIAGARVFGLGPSVQTDGGGRFALQVLGTTRETLRVVASGYANEVRDVDVQSGAVPEIEIALKRGAATEVRVVDAATGLPVMGFYAVEDASRFVDGGAIEPGGLARFTLQPGAYKLTVHARDGYKPKTLPITVPGPPLVVTLERE